MSDLHPSRLVAVVVSYNRLPKLKKTLARLLSTPEQLLSRVVICDNASTDGTAAWLADQTDPRLDVLTLPENVGGSGGFHAGLAYARETQDADWYVLMDDDASPEVGALAAFHSAPRSTADLWYSAVRYPSGEICDMNKPWINPFLSPRRFFSAAFGGRDSFHITEADYASPQTRAVDGGSFVGLFVSREALALAGLPRKELFIYADDVLFALTLRKKGGTARFDPALAFEHDCESLPKGSHVFRPLWRAYFYHRNITLVYRQIAGPVLFWPILAAKYVQWQRHAAEYGEDAATYRNLLRRAVKDALKGEFSARPDTL